MPGMYMPRNNDAVRTSDGKVVLYLSPTHPSPVNIPHELQDYITPEEWQGRISALTALAGRYYKPLLERVWMFFALISILVLPIALYNPIFLSLYKADDDVPSHFFAVRMISFAIFVSTCLLFWVPVFLWKSIGRKRVNALLNTWARHDRMMKRSENFVPEWRATTPTLFTSQVILSITVPPRNNYTQSIFAPDATVPPYIAPALDSGAPYYYPYAPGQAGIPRMSVVGGLPPYSKDDADRKPFDDIKV